MLVELANGLWKKPARRDGRRSGRAGLRRFGGSSRKSSMSPTWRSPLWRSRANLTIRSMTAFILRSRAAAARRSSPRIKNWWLASPAPAIGTMSSASSTGSEATRDVRPDRRPSRRPRHGEIFRRRAYRALRAQVGRNRAFSGRRPARRRRARDGGDLCQRTAWRQRHDPPRRGADLRGAVDRLPLDRFLPFHPQHGRLGGRPLRLAGLEGALSASGSPEWSSSPATA